MASPEEVPGQGGRPSEGGAQVSRLFSRSLIYIAGTAFSQIVAFLMVPVYTRVLTPTDYGVLDLLDTADYLVVAVFSTAITNGVLRFFHDAQGPRERHAVISTAFISLLLTGALVASLGWLVAPLLAPTLLRSNARAGLLQLTFVAMAFQGAVEVPFAWLRGTDRPFTFVAGSLFRLVVGLSLNIVLVVVLRFGVRGMVLSGLVTSALTLLAVGAPVLRRTGLTVDLALLRAMLRFGWPLVPGAVAMIALNKARAFVLGAYASLADVGVWSLGFRFGVGVSILVGWPFGFAWTAQMYQVWASPNGKETYRRVGTALLFVLVWAAASVTTLAPELLGVMAPEAFRNARLVIPAVAFAYVLRELAEFFRNGLLVARDARPIAWIEPLLAVVDLALGLVLIPRYGLHGALVSVPLVFGLYALLLHRAVRRALPVSYEYGRMALVALLGGAWTLAGVAIHTGSLAADLALKAVLLGLFPVAGVVLIFRHPAEREGLRMLASRVLPRRAPVGQ